MDDRQPEDSLQQELELERMMHEMLQAQLSLQDSVTATSQFLRFVLGIAGENLGVIKTQLERIRDLAETIDQSDSA